MQHQRSVTRLEHFLEVVLRKDLDKALRERDALFQRVADCTHFRTTIQELRNLSQDGSGESNSGAKILVDVGCNFFMKCKVVDTSTVLVNIGCGVVLPMACSEADVFLMKKERLLKEMAAAKTRESLRLRFRIRLVMEAITRLEAAQLRPAQRRK